MILTIPAPEFPPVRRKKTGKLSPVNVWLNANGRAHRQAEVPIIRAWREAGRAASAGLPQRDGRTRIVAYVFKPRRGRYDPGNLYAVAKAAVDGLVDSGILVDDDWKHLDGPDMRHGGIGPARLVLVIEPAETHAGIAA